MKPCLVDTNLVLRFLTGEPERQAARARRLFAANEAGDCPLKIIPLVVAEVVFVLSGQSYGYPRSEVASAMTSFLQSPSLEVEKRDILIRALELFGKHRIDFADACLAAEAQLEEISIASFDADFEKITGLQRHPF